MTSILIKRPVAFRVQRANDDGITLSKTEWRYFTDETEAARESDALCADCQALFVRDGTAIVAEWQGMETAPKDGSPVLGVWWSNIAVGKPPESHIGICSWAGVWTPYDRKLTHWMPLPAPPPLSVGQAASRESREAVAAKPFYGAQCFTYPDCSGGCGLGCTHTIEKARINADLNVAIDDIAKWLHDETAHPESYPDRTWPETDRDDGRREGGFVKIVPKHGQAYFRDIARRLIARFGIPDVHQRSSRSTLPATSE